MTMACTRNGTGIGRKLGEHEKVARQAAELAVFIQRYARKAQPGAEPNDCRYGRDTEARIKRMRPYDLDRLLRDDEVDPV